MDWKRLARRARRMGEVQWAMLAFFLILALFNIALYPLVEGERKEPRPPAPAAEAGEVSPAAPPIRLEFAVAANGQVFHGGRLAGPAEIRTIFAGLSGPAAVELNLASPSLFAILQECSKHGVAPAVRASRP